MTTQMRLRRYELDWLRVIAFALLVFFHTGMFFVSWDWHIKNNVISEAIEWPMIFLSQWRMSLIFLISGAGVYYAMGYKSPKMFVRDRLKRILVPLVAGIILVVPPQVFLERLAQGAEFGYFEFYLTFLKFEPYPNGNFSWHHLWFLVYILVYSLCFLPLLHQIRQKNFSFNWVSSWMIIVLPGLWLGIGESWLRPLFPTTGAFIDDWANHFLYISIFVLGFILISSEYLQEKIQRLRWYSLGVALLLISILYSQFWLSNTGFVLVGEVVYRYIVSLNRWCWLIAILGFAIQHLNKKNRSLKVLNEMVYPFYILHQTVIVILAFYFKDMPWSVGGKFSIILIGTFAICYVLIRYLIMRVNMLRLPFGLKPYQKLKNRNVVLQSDKQVLQKSGVS
ncbi:acyltransferase family protein [Algoriphagus sp. AGSA1]|uniref:acyltransferase family protein n=1 Tax=Algoriphagus sp. AGSA1 TaxID=2907213 RepID=UPI001F3299D2|nr:acyltransferase family protein [Algoriphagus sp. AGSA1]MCE7053136.1 acyltransferase family protein [Algoriphagus sp. AGSA1]